MAITEILGSDLVSASRETINDNFAELDARAPFAAMTGNDAGLLKLTNALQTALSIVGLILETTNANDEAKQWGIYAQKSAAGASGATSLQIRNRNADQSEAWTPIVLDSNGNNIYLNYGFLAGAQAHGDTFMGGNIFAVGPVYASEGITDNSGGTAFHISAAGFKLRDDLPFRWSSTDNWSETADAGIARNAAGIVEVNNGTPGTLADLKVRNIIVATQTPASAAAAGTAGMIAWDASYIYICVADATWKRVAIATW